MKLYGSLTNRLEEGKNFCNEIKVGTGMTEYMWTDRHAYEVIRVDTQEHLWVRQYEVRRTDKNGMSEIQDYEYIPNIDNQEIELVKRNNKWYKVKTYNKDRITNIAKCRILKGNGFANKNLPFEKQVEIDVNYTISLAGLTETQKKRFYEGKEIKRYTLWDNISFGVAEEYYDYSF